MSSLKTKLHDIVISKGYLGYGDMCQFTVEEGYKIATSERRLRYLCADKDEKKRPQIPDIEPIMAISKRGTNYISGWRRREKEKEKCWNCRMEYCICQVSHQPQKVSLDRMMNQVLENRKMANISPVVARINSILLHKAENNQTKLF